MNVQNFKIQAIPREVFEPLLGLSNTELTAHHAKWIVADVEPGYPCRVSLEDAKQGERILALSYLYHDCESPYRAAGPIFVREHSITANPEPGEIPLMLRHRLLSLRGYNKNKDMVCAEVIKGSKLDNAITAQFQSASVEYLHIHNAMPGCFNCAVRRT